MAGQVTCPLACASTPQFAAATASHVPFTAVPFGGFRLSADLYLHLLNLQVYLITKVQMHGVHKEVWPTFSTAAAAFCVFTLLPMGINVVFEANVRSQYLTRHNLSQSHLPKFWHGVLRWGMAASIQG